MVHLLVLVDAMNGVIAASGALVLERVDLSIFVLWERAMEMFLKDWLHLDLLKLGFEVFGNFGLRGRIGATTRIGHVDVTDVIDLISWVAPVFVI